MGLNFFNNNALFPMEPANFLKLNFPPLPLKENFLPLASFPNAPFLGFGATFGFPLATFDVSFFYSSYFFSSYKLVLTLSYLGFYSFFSFFYF